MQKSSQEEIKYLERILSENSNSTLFARLADAYLRADRVDDAIELCEFGVKKHPVYATGHFILGKCFLKKKLRDEAEKELKRAIMYDPKFIAAHREYGELMASIGWHTTCDMTFQEIVNIDPLNEKAKSRLAELKKQFSIDKEKKIEERDDLKFAIKEMDDSFVDNLDKIKDTQKETEIDNLELDERIHEEKAEAEFEMQDSPDEGDVSMDLLEDIFRDTSIPELESEDLPPVEGTFASDKETTVTETSEQMQSDQPSSEEPDEFQLATENAAEVSTEQGYTPIHEQDEPLAAEPSPPTNYFEQPRREDDLEQSTETEIPVEEKISLEESDDSRFGSDAKQPSEDDEIEDTNSIPDIPPEEPTTDSPVEYPGFDSESETTPPQNTITQQDDSRLGLDIKQPGEDDKIEGINSIPAIPQEEQTTDNLVEFPEFDPESVTAQPQETMVQEQEVKDEESSEKKKEKIVTPTLGEIYTAQHQYSKAISVYELLLKKEPDNEVYKQKIEHLNEKLEESENE
jgi:tetratricopeptide (TPR) repeat protein